MQKLKGELRRIGAHVKSDDITDPDDFTGIRRLRILHKKAIDEQATTVAPRGEPPLTAQATVVTTPEAVTKASVTTDSKSLTMLSSEDGFISGLSTWESVGVILGGAVFLAILSYVIYKYLQWRPKQIARKGYRAVAKSKGLQQEDSTGNVSSDGIIRAGTRPDTMQEK